MTKNIYQVIDTKTRKVVGMGFKNREDAKKVRNELNDKAKSMVVNDSKPRYVVSRGSDHPLGETDGFGKQFKKRLNKRRKNK